MNDCEKKDMLLLWLKMHNKKILWKNLLEQYNYRKVVIAGYREFGRLLVEELSRENLILVGIIEKNYESLTQLMETDIPVVGFGDNTVLLDADVVIVTPDLDHQEVRENLDMNGVRVPLLNLQDLLSNCEFITLSMGV